VARSVGQTIADEFRVCFEPRQVLDLMGTTGDLVFAPLTALLFMVKARLISAIAFSWYCITI